MSIYIYIYIYIYRYIYTDEYIYIYIYIYIQIYNTYYMSQSVIWLEISRAGIFMSQRRVKIKPESEISRHNTLTRVISGLFHTRYLHYHS